VKDRVIHCLQFNGRVVLNVRTHTPSAMSARASYFGLCQNGSTYHSALLCVPLSELKPYSKLQQIHLQRGINSAGHM